MLSLNKPAYYMMQHTQFLFLKHPNKPKNFMAEESSDKNINRLVKYFRGQNFTV